MTGFQRLFDTIDEFEEATNQFNESILGLVDVVGDLPAGPERLKLAALVADVHERHTQLIRLYSKLVIQAMDMITEDPLDGRTSVHRR